MSRKIASNGEVEKVSHLVVAQEGENSRRRKEIIGNVLTSRKKEEKGKKQRLMQLRLFRLQTPEEKKFYVTP